MLRRYISLCTYLIIMGNNNQMVVFKTYWFICGRGIYTCNKEFKFFIYLPNHCSVHFAILKFRVCTTSTALVTKEFHLLLISSGASFLCCWGRFRNCFNSSNLPVMTGLSSYWNPCIMWHICLLGHC